MRLVFLLVCLPALALAQNTSGLTLQVQGQDSQTVSGSQCGSTVQITWTVGVGGIACSDLLIWASAATCADAPATGDFQIADIGASTWSTQTTGTEDVLVSDLPIDFGADAGSCGSAVEATVNLCASLKVGSYDCSFPAPQVVHASPQATIVYDNVAPIAPTVSAVDGIDGALKVTVSVPSDAARVAVEYQKQGDPTWTSAGDVSSENPHTTINGLVNGVTYDVRAFAVDAAGNQSGYSNVKSGQPIETIGFWGAYQKDHGSETGGCTAGGAGGMLAGLMVLIGLLWRKR